MKVPILQAAIWPATAPGLVAAVCEAGSIGADFESADSFQRQIARVHKITPRPFAVNHVVPLLDEAAFQATLGAKPEVVSAIRRAGG
jgi:NAD(P)H-dependent flavin oxidoreductase YrpB (nitropropane dioxygenase family)